MHRLRLPGNPHIQSAAFSVDGETLFVQVIARSINVWEILLYFWPEILGGSLAIVILVCVLMLWRIAHRPRIVGEPHCRRCNYCVRGVESGRCPECGTPTRRTIRGRSFKRRMFPFAFPAAGFLIVYGGLWAIQFPRSGPAVHWVNWWWDELLDRAAAQGVSLRSWERDLIRILEVDVCSGRLRGTLITLDRIQAASCPLTVTPDGRGLILPTGDRDQVAMFDTRSGRLRSTLQLPDAKIAGFDDTGSIAYAAYMDKPAGRSRVVSWDLDTGAYVALFDLPTDKTRFAFRDSFEPRRLYRVPGQPELRFLDLPSNPLIGERSVVTARIRSADLNGTISCEFPVPLRPYADPLFSSDGSLVYLATTDSMSGFMILNTETGTLLDDWAVPPWFHNGFPESVAPFNRLVVCTSNISLDAHSSSMTLGFLVGDTRSRRWIGAFVAPEGDEYDDKFISPDGRFFAVECLSRELEGGKRQNELLIYDLRELPHDLPILESKRLDVYHRNYLYPAGSEESSD